VVYPLVVRTLESYHLVGREADGNRTELAAFRDWRLAKIETNRMKTTDDAARVRGSRAASDLRH
jgi:LysR family glycine cleavage system transcriptional activator